MKKPKSMGLMNTQPLNKFIDISNPHNFMKLYPDKNSAVSLQIGGGTYSQPSNIQKFRISQKAKNRSVANTKPISAISNIDKNNIRYFYF